ncbi:MAG: hypothetical protein IJ011_01980 [Clostridia bacterium]|nr:hypothetical protein [Clostridia bacterium]
MTEKTNIIDFHTHILPCADHGSDGINTSREQIALINDAGVSTAVLTPHFYPHRHTVAGFTENVSAAAEALISGTDRRPRLCIGAEVLYCDGIEDMEGLETLCIRGTNILLLELPKSEWSKGLLYEVRRLSSKYTVVLAHIDRYLPDKAEELKRLLSYGALAQINTASLFNVVSRICVSPFVESGQIYAVGSDLHGVDKKAYSQFVKARKKLGDEYTKIMERSAKLLDGAEFI